MSYNESLNSNSNYPVMSQSEWDNAPWNEEEHPKEEVEVEVVVTLVKTVKVEVDDYIIKDGGVDEDNYPYKEIDFTECDFTRVLDKATIKGDLKNIDSWKLEDFDIFINK